MDAPICNDVGSGSPKPGVGTHGPTTGSGPATPLRGAGVEREAHIMGTGGLTQPLSRGERLEGDGCEPGMGIVGLNVQGMEGKESEIVDFLHQVTQLRGYPTALLVTETWLQGDFLPVLDERALGITYGSAWGRGRNATGREEPMIQWCGHSGVVLHQKLSQQSSLEQSRDPGGHRPQHRLSGGIGLFICYPTNGSPESHWQWKECPFKEVNTSPRNRDQLIIMTNERVALIGTYLRPSSGRRGLDWQVLNGSVLEEIAFWVTYFRERDVTPVVFGDMNARVGNYIKGNADATTNAGGKRFIKWLRTLGLTIHGEVLPSYGPTYVGGVGIVRGADGVYLRGASTVDYICLPPSITESTAAMHEPLGNFEFDSDHLPVAATLPKFCTFPNAVGTVDQWHASDTPRYGIIPPRSSKRYRFHHGLSDRLKFLCYTRETIRSFMTQEECRGSPPNDVDLLGEPQPLHMGQWATALVAASDEVYLLTMDRHRRRHVRHIDHLMKEHRDLIRRLNRARKKKWYQIIPDLKRQISKSRRRMKRRNTQWRYRSIMTQLKANPKRAYRCVKRRTGTGGFVGDLPPRVYARPGATPTAAATGSALEHNPPTGETRRIARDALENDEAWIARMAADLSTGLEYVRTSANRQCRGESGQDEGRAPATTPNPTGSCGCDWGGNAALNLSTATSGDSAGANGPPVTPEELMSIIRKLPNHRGEGIDMVKYEMLKLLLPGSCPASRTASGGNPRMAEAQQADTLGMELVAKLAETMTATLNQNVELPPAAFQSIIQPVYKGNGSKPLDPLDPYNYRPIALQSALTKVYERVILRRLEASLALKAVPNVEQTGFLKGSSTSHALVGIYLTIRERATRRLPTYAAFVDIKSAYDGVNRGRLCDILRLMEAPGYLVRAVEKLLQPGTGVIRRWDGGLTRPFVMSDQCIN